MKTGLPRKWYVVQIGKLTNCRFDPSYHNAQTPLQFSHRSHGISIAQRHSKRIRHIANEVNAFPFQIKDRMKMIRHHHKIYNRSIRVMILYALKILC